MSQNNIKAVIFDVDGTLVDSNDAHARSWVEVMREFGYEVDYDKVRHLIGMGGDNLMPAAIGVEEDSQKGQQIAERREQLYKEKYQSELQPFARVRELVQRLSEQGMQLIAASSGEQEMVDANLKIADVDDLIRLNTSSDDTENSKPDPDIVQAALDKLGVQAEQAIMIGDSPYDVQAAAKCGVRVIGVRCGGFSDEDLADAIEIYDDPADLLSRLEQSILHQNSSV